MIENETQYTNEQMNNAFKNHITMRLSGLIVQYNNLTVTETHVATIIRYEKQTDVQNH